MDASERIQHFLHLIEAHDLDSADDMMAPNAVIIYPGGKQYSSQEEAVEAARGRYQWIRKTINRIDTFVQHDDTIVYVMGTLYGMNSYGVEFGDVRFIDRFALREGLITSQQVWNDLAESGVLEQS